MAAHAPEHGAAGAAAPAEWLVGRVARVHYAMAAVGDGECPTALACDVALDRGGVDRHVPLKDVRPWRAEETRRIPARTAAHPPLARAVARPASKRSARREEELDAALCGGRTASAGVVYIDARRMHLAKGVCAAIIALASGYP